MKKLIIVLVIFAIIIIANIIIFNLLNNNNKDIASTNTHVNTNVNTANNTDANQLNQERTNNGDASTVCFTSDISSEGLMKYIMNYNSNHKEMLQLKYQQERPEEIIIFLQT